MLSIDSLIPSSALHTLLEPSASEESLVPSSPLASIMTDLVSSTKLTPPSTALIRASSLELSDPKKLEWFHLGSALLLDVLRYDLLSLHAVEIMLMQGTPPFVSLILTMSEHRGVGPVSVLVPNETEWLWHGTREAVFL